MTFDPARVSEELGELENDIDELIDMVQEKREYHQREAVAKGSQYHTGMWQAYNDCLKHLRGVRDND